MWVRLVNALCGTIRVSSPLIPMKAWLGPWNGITRTLERLHNRGFHLHALCPIRIWDNASTSFWHDGWKGNLPLDVSFHRLYVLDNRQFSSVVDRSYTLVGYGHF